MLCHVLFTQLFFNDEDGKDRFTSKADIWSGLLTLIYVLLGKNERIVPLEKVRIIKAKHQLSGNVSVFSFLKHVYQLATCSYVYI